MATSPRAQERPDAQGPAVAAAGAVLVVSVPRAARAWVSASGQRTAATLLGLALGLVVSSRPARTQESPTADSDSLSSDTLSAVRCTGQIVSGIDVRPARPEFGGASGVWRILAHAVGLRNVTTRDDVIAGMLQLSVGDPCTEFRRAESERLLRAQPFLAAATVRAVPDGEGGVRIDVRTVDEVPAFIEGRLSGAMPEAIAVGNGNVQGRAISVAVSGQRGHAYRDGFGIRVDHYAMFDGPYAASLEAERRPLGSIVGVALARPFYTELQRTTWRVSFRDDRGYRRIVRPAGDPLALGLRQTRWDAGGLYRRRLLGQVGGVGLALTGVRDTPAQEGVIVTDLDLAPDTGVTLRDRYAPFRVVRPAALVGVRLVRFVTVQGFNTLAALEDLPSGLQAGGSVGRGIPAWGASDLFLAGSIYAGHATPGSLVALQLELEGRKDYDLGEWNGLIASSRLAWYSKRSARRTFVVSEEFSGGSRARLPLQLTFRDGQGGLRGYRGSLLSGAWRNVVRFEERWVLASRPRNANVGFAGFADAGTLWRGSAPYGQTVPLRASVGASVLAAFPAGSKRVLRLDLAVPLRRDGNKAWELRFSSNNLTRHFWREPGDVSRARTGPIPSTLFTWPAR